MMLDYHMHTTFSDGKNSIKEMIDTAEKLGLKTIAITDHIWRNSDWFDEYFELIKKENIDRSLNILVGFEAKALSINGEIDATNEMCNSSDMRIGAIHRIPEGNILNKYLTRECISNDPQNAYKNWLQTTKNMIKNKHLDVVAHPCMALIKYNLEAKEKDIHSLFVLVKKYNKKLEISNRYKKSNNLLIKILITNPNFLSYISYGSDAHSIDDLKKAHNND
jgi:HisJ family histidinol phosphate phosphatase